MLLLLFIVIIINKNTRYDEVNEILLYNLNDVLSFSTFFFYNLHKEFIINVKNKNENK